jgi:hypothetical protein
MSHMVGLHCVQLGFSVLKPAGIVAMPAPLLNARNRPQLHAMFAKKN